VRFEKVLEKKKKQYTQRKNPHSVKIELDEDKRLFDISNLNYHDIRYLLNHNYKIIYQPDLKGKRGFYLIKPFENESKQHCFLVNLIYFTLKENFEYVKTYNTKEPDIVFRFKNKFIALEIETGKVFRRHKQRFLEKLSMLKQNYGEDYFFIVTNRDNLGKYKQFGKTLTRKNFLRKLSSYVGFDIK
jgi:hypothetical protein